MVIVHVFVLVLALLSFVSVACISPVNCINKLINFSQHEEYCTLLFCTVLYCTVLCCGMQEDGGLCFVRDCIR